MMPSSFFINRYNSLVIFNEPMIYIYVRERMQLKNVDCVENDRMAVSVIIIYKMVDHNNWHTG